MEERQDIFYVCFGSLFTNFSQHDMFDRSFCLQPVTQEQKGNILHWHLIPVT